MNKLILIIFLSSLTACGSEKDTPEIRVSQSFNVTNKIIGAFIQGRYGNEDGSFKHLETVVGDLDDDSSEVSATYSLNNKKYYVFLFRNDLGEIINTTVPELSPKQ